MEKTTKSIDPLTGAEKIISKLWHQAQRCAQGAGGIARQSARDG